MPDHKPEEKQVRGSSAASIGRLSAIITILPASMAAGWIFGYFALDRWFHVYPWCSITFTLLGAGAGFYEILKILTPGEKAEDGHKHE